MNFFTRINSPIGELFLVSDGDFLRGLYLQSHQGRNSLELLQSSRVMEESQLQLFQQAEQQLAEYFAGERRAFDLPLKPEGTDFQKLVWQELLKISYGSSVSYGEIAARMGRPAASRAVGMANGRNPLSIIVPCHRVIGHDGRLTGYSGGLPGKLFLLELEKRTLLSGTINPCHSASPLMSSANL